MKKYFLLLAQVFVLNTAIAQCPIVNAGPDVSACMESEIPLSGSITGNYTNALWVTRGSGSFLSSASELQTSYVLSENDKQSKFITLILVATNSEGCNSEDSIVIKTSDVAQVTLGKDINSCSRTVNLTGYTEEGGISWSSSGTGTFKLGTDSLNVIYQASLEDSTNNTPVYIVLNTNKGSHCYPGTDTLQILFRQIKISIFSEAVKSCYQSKFDVHSQEGDSLSLTANAPGFFTKLSKNTYTFQPSDFQKNDFWIFASTVPLHSCPGTTDSIEVQIFERPFVDAGPVNLYSEGTVSLSGKASKDAKIVWSSGGSGVFTITDSLNTIYEPSLEDLYMEYVTIRLTALSNFSCPSSEDWITVYFKGQSVINGAVIAGRDSSLKYKVSLFKKINDSYELIEQQQLTDQNYSFNNLNQGSYITQAELLPEDPLFGAFLPTYSGNAISWHSSYHYKINNFDDLIFEIINLAENPVINTIWNSGFEEISGVVTVEDHSISGTNNLLLLNNALVILYDNNANYLSHVRTNENGFYEFTNLIPGDYMLKVELAGTLSEKIPVNVDNDPTTTASGDLSIKNFTVSGITSGKYSSEISLFPNPVNETLSIEIPSSNKTVNVTIMDYMGKVIYETMFQYYHFSISVSQLKEGFYFLSVSSETNTYHQSFLKK